MENDHFSRNLGMYMMVEITGINDVTGQVRQDAQRNPGYDHRSCGQSRLGRRSSLYR